MPGAGMRTQCAEKSALVIAACDWLRDEFSCTVLPIHHSGKDAERGARGTSALRGAWDTAFEVSGHGKTVILKVADQKDGESGEVLVFDMVGVQVGLRTTLVPVLRAPSDEADVSGSKRRLRSGSASQKLQPRRRLPGAGRYSCRGPESAHPCRRCPNCRPAAETRGTTDRGVAPGVLRAWHGRTHTRRPKRTAFGSNARSMPSSRCGWSA